MKAASPAVAETHARDEIVRAAAEVFMEFGFAGSTIDAVASRLGSTKGRIYHYYGSKAELYFDIQIAAMERLMGEIRPIALAPLDTYTKLHRMALRHAEILLMDLPIQKVAVQGLERRLLLSLGVRNSKPLRSVIRLRDDYEQVFAEVIDEGTRAGIFIDQPARLLAKPFFGAMNWATVWYTPRRLQAGEDVAAIAGLLADFAMRGLCREAEPCARK